jgi:hypothetical protein
MDYSKPGYIMVAMWFFAAIICLIAGAYTGAAIFAFVACIRIYLTLWNARS